MSKLTDSSDSGRMMELFVPYRASFLCKKLAHCNLSAQTVIAYAKAHDTPHNLVLCTDSIRIFPKNAGARKYNSYCRRSIEAVINS